MKSVKLDQDAHNILTKVKNRMKGEGIESPSMSDAIRYLYHLVDNKKGGKSE